MSLHVRHHDYGNASTDAGGHVGFWTAWCGCGWKGERHFLHESSEAADKARNDYAQHITEAMGADGFYSAAVACSNCGSRHQQGIVVGTPVYSAPCSNCGQTMVKPDNDVWHENSRERSGWRF